MECSTPPQRPLRRDSFVANALWAGISFACEGRLSGDLDFRGNHESGQVSCNDGQGDSFKVLWDEHGVQLVVYELGELPVQMTPSPPPALRGLTEAVAGGRAATRGLWICGDSSSPRLPLSSGMSLFKLVDAFCGPPLIADDEAHRLERDLFGAIGSGPVELPSGLIRRLLDSPHLRRSVDHHESLDAARAVAEDLSRFGLIWPNVERDVTERG
jgi:hypothetical protein